MPRTGKHKSKENDDPLGGLKPYEFHGVELAYKPGDAKASGDCPICGRTGKFDVKLATGQFGCFKCGEGGSVYDFLRWLHTASLEQTSQNDYQELAGDRNLPHWKVLEEWGLAKSLLTDDWLLPCWNLEGGFTQLYRWLPAIENGKQRLAWHPTPGKAQNLNLGHRMFGLNPELFDPDKPGICLCEGIWDCLSLYSALISKRLEGFGTLEDVNVLGLPSATTFKPAWCEPFAGRILVLCGQNDHPRTNAKSGKQIIGASLSGMQRIVRLLLASDYAPSSIYYLHWGEGGYNPDLKTGYDLRDHFFSNPN